MDLPPFAGGAVGMFAYDLVRTVEPLGEPNPDPLGVPDLALMLTDALVVFDHLQAHDHRGRPPQTTTPRPRERRSTEIAGGRWPAPLPRAATDGRDPPADRARPEFDSNMTREQFEANVERIIDYIYAGDAFQVVP